MQDVVERISAHHILLSYDKGVPEFVAHASYSVEFGARNISRFIEQSIENQLSKLILSNSLQSGGVARVIVENNSLVIKI